MKNTLRLAALVPLLFLPGLVSPPAHAQREPRGTPCANENGRCEFAGTATIYYGARDRWVTRQASNGIDCNNQTFGDPIVGVVKRCFREGGMPLVSAPRGERCARENGRCDFRGAATIYYGAKNRWVTRSASDGIDCNNATFGDPIVGVVKDCYRDGGRAAVEAPRTRHIALQSDTGQFFSRCRTCQDTVGDLPDTATVHIPSPDRNPWARMEVVPLSNGKVALKADTGKYFARCNGCIRGGTTPDFITVHATNPEREPWAQFTLEQLPGGKVALRSDTGKYVARCNGCSSSSKYPDTVTVHMDSWRNAPWAQWTLVEVP